MQQRPLRCPRKLSSPSSKGSIAGQSFFDHCSIGRRSGRAHGRLNQGGSRMSRMRLAVLVAAVMAFAAAPAFAMTVGGEAFGTFSTYSMKDWNDLIDQSNTSGSNFDNVNGGIGGGLGLR